METTMNVIAVRSAKNCHVTITAYSDNKIVKELEFPLSDLEDWATSLKHADDLPCIWQIDLDPRLGRLACECVIDITTSKGYETFLVDY
jgi:hypothetical protein